MFFTHQCFCETICCHVLRRHIFQVYLLIFYCKTNEWYRSCICFVLGWSPGFLASAIAPWLSPKSVVGCVCLNPSCSSKFLSQITSCVARVQAMYSASVEESAGEDCNLLLQLTADPHILNTYPLVDLRVSSSPAQSESVYPRMIVDRSSSLLYVLEKLIPDPLFHLGTVVHV